MTKDEEIILFHFQLGSTITQCSKIEHILRNIVVACFDNKNLNHEALSIGMFSLDGFNAKLNFANGVVARKLAGNKHSAEWGKLVDKARQLSSSRNKLAHWSIGEYWECGEGQRVVLVPWVYQKPKRRTRIPRPPAGSLNIRDIYRARSEFLSFAILLHHFFCKICGLEEPTPIYDTLINDPPPTTRTLMREIRDVCATQKK